MVQDSDTRRAALAHGFGLACKGEYDRPGRRGSAPEEARRRQHEGRWWIHGDHAAMSQATLAVVRVVVVTAARGLDVAVVVRVVPVVVVHAMVVPVVVVPVIVVPVIERPGVMTALAVTVGREQVMQRDVETGQGFKAQHPQRAQNQRPCVPRGPLVEPCPHCG
jgi:hypothetical protein